MLLMIDNYDSFTYNVVQYLAELGQEVEVYRNDQIAIDEIRKLKPGGIVISPGPCTPNEAGVSMEVVKAFGNELPILGICLGHQSIGQVFGGHVVKARAVMHGKTSEIHHTGEGVFAGLPNPFIATRYHSLIVDRDSMPAELKVTAWSLDEAGEVDEVMGLRHASLAIQGVQFHPESILTSHGHDLLSNFIADCHQGE